MKWTVANETNGNFCTAIAAALPLVVVAGLLASPAIAQDRTITVVLKEEPITLDPCQTVNDNVGKASLGTIVERLARRDFKTGELTPHLATSWTQVDDLTWRFELRDGVTFHDGTPFNAAAAKYAIERNLNPPLTCQVLGKYFGDQTIEVREAGEHAIEVVTERPNGILPLLMSTHTFYSTSVPFDEPTREAVVGSGPYRFVEWQAGVQIVLERNPDYWGDQPEAEKVIITWRDESSVRAAMIQRGEADLAPNISFQDAQAYPDLGRAYPNSETTRVVLDPLKAPMSDARVRAAINYAIDREGIRGTILSPDVIHAKVMVIPQVNGHNPNIKTWPYQPELAKALVAAAKADGVPVDQEIQFVGRNGHFPGVRELMEAITAMLNDTGLNVRLDMMEGAQRSKLMKKPFAGDRPPQLFIGQHDNTGGDAVFTVFNKYGSQGESSKLEDPYLDFLIDYATVQTGDQRTWAWQTAFERINEDLIADAMLFHMVGYVAVGPRIDYVPNPYTNQEVRVSDITFK